jgi:hypothetical protein
LCEDGFYCIDYLIYRIIYIDKLYDSTYQKIELDHYYLLQLVDRIDNYDECCSESSAQFIKDILKTRELKRKVFDELESTPPIDNLYCGGTEYWQGLSRFNLLQ